LQAVAALRSKKIAKYGGKWDFLGQTASRLSSYGSFFIIFIASIPAVRLQKGNNDTHPSFFHLRQQIPGMRFSFAGSA
jgi:hypothetical protein